LLNYHHKTHALGCTCKIRRLTDLNVIAHVFWEDWEVWYYSRQTDKIASAASTWTSRRIMLWLCRRQRSADVMVCLKVVLIMQ